MDGILIINKPKGYTSRDVVNIVKKTLNTPKVGHTGTLDPNATGVLPILLGKATKVSKYLIEHDKEYIAELKLGEKSSTGDPEGEIIEKCAIPTLNQEEISKVLSSFQGKQLQTPPIYSSIKINGKKAYEYARSGQKIEMPSREIEVYEINLISFENNNIIFKVHCSKGTYIRTLCEEIAQKLGTVGMMNNLCRTKVDEFEIKNAITLDELQTLDNLPLISIENTFKNLKSIYMDNKKTSLFLNGVKLTYHEPDGVYKIYNNNIFLGLGVINNKLLKRDVVIIDNWLNYV